MEAFRQVADMYMYKLYVGGFIICAMYLHGRSWKHSDRLPTCIMYKLYVGGFICIMYFCWIEANSEEAIVTTCWKYFYQMF